MRSDRSHFAAPLSFKLVLLILCMLACGCFDRLAAAQMMPLVPDPVTTPELMKYGELIGLSDQQKLGLLTAHDNYKQRYREFQDRDVRKLQDELLNIVTQFQRGKFNIPERKELESIVEQFKKVLNNAHAVDRSLFAEIQTNLTEAQVAKMPRATNARELAVYRDLVTNFAGEFNPGARVNLTELTRKLDLSPAEVEQTDLILTEYEGVLLSKTREVYGIIIKAVNVILDLVDELNLRNMTPEQMMATMGDEKLQVRLKSTFDEASKPFQAAAFELSQLNLRTFRKLCGTIRPELVADLRDRFFERGYDDAYDGPGAWRERYRQALLLPSLTSQQTEAITAQRDGSTRQDDSLIDSMVNALEASREYRSFAVLEEQGRNPRLEKIEDQKGRRKDLAQNAENALVALLSPDLLVQLQKQMDDKSKQVKKNKNRDRDEDADDDDGEGEHSTEVTVAASSNGETKIEVKPIKPDDSMQPQPITINRIQGLGKKLKWTEQEQATLNSLYDDYRVDFDKLRSTPLAGVEDSEDDDKPETDAGKSGDSKPVDEYKARRERYEQLAAIDEDLYENLALLAADDNQQKQLRRFKGMRQREAATESAKKMASVFGGDEGYIDLVAIVSASDLNAASESAVNDLLNGYETSVSVAVNKRLEAAREVYRRSNWQRNPSKGGASANPQAQEFRMKKWREAYQQLRDTNKEIAKLNRETLDQVVNQLPQDTAWQVKLAYNQAGYPEVYRDAVTSEKVLQALMGMEALSEPQREAVHEISNQFRGEYYAICEQMVDLQRQRDFDPSNFQMPGREMMEREMQNARLDFDRTEIASRARMRLKLALPAEVVGKIPELRK